MQGVKRVHRRGMVVSAFRIWSPVTHDQIGVEEPALYLAVAARDHFDRAVAVVADAARDKLAIIRFIYERFQLLRTVRPKVAGNRQLFSNCL